MSKSENSGAPPPKVSPPTPLFRLEAIEDGESARFTARIGKRNLSLLAVRRGGNVLVYVNACPHIGAPLDFLPGRFLNPEKTLIQCANHGALFRIEDGFCIHGPCAGGTLEPIPVVVRDGAVFST